MTQEKHLYLIGIGGVGMVWIADYALAQGWRVSGSELTESAEVSRLRAAGAAIHIGADVTKVPDDITEAVITSAITPTAPSYSEYEKIIQMGIPVSKRAVWIGKLTKRYTTVAVCGAHGKTTTTAMIGWILTEAGVDPTVFVGGTVGTWHGTRIGKGKVLVLEADEFDRSFHQFYPQLVVALNIDLDHTDYYKEGLPEIEASYRHFFRNLPHKTGLFVGYGKDGRIRKAVKGFKYITRWYSEDALWPGVKLPQPGLHNLLNATAAARVAHELGVSHDVIKNSLATFPGAGRRFEYLGTWQHAELYDDYAHHPREVAATLSGVAEKFSDKKVTLVFQPHQKARTKALLAEFGKCFNEHPPHTLILAPIYFVAGREEGIEITSQAIADEIMKQAPAGMELKVAQTEAELEVLTKEASQTSDVLMVMGAGSIRALVDTWRK